MITNCNFRYCQLNRHITQTPSNYIYTLHGIDKILLGLVSKWDQQSQYWICHVQVQLNHWHWLVTVVYILKVTEARKIKSESWSPSQQIYNTWYSLIFHCLLCFGNQCFWEVIYVIVRSVMLCNKISQCNLLDIWKICVEFCDDSQQKLIKRHAFGNS